MAKFSVILAAGSRGAVARANVNLDVNDPWPGALQAASKAIKKGDGKLTGFDTTITVHVVQLAVEGEGEEA